MRLLYIILYIALPALLLCGCDEGDINPSSIQYNKDGRSVRLKGNIKGLDQWSSKYSLRLASFDDDSSYPILSKEVSASEDGTVDMRMTGISDDATKVELCVLDRLRRRVFTLKEVDITSVSDTVYMDVGTLDGSMFGVMQTQVFDNLCIGCHRDGENPSAQLTLTQGKSYASLVNKASYKDNGAILAKPYDSGSSVLYQLMVSSLQEWHMPHKDIIKESSVKEYIREWIESGCPGE